MDGPKCGICARATGTLVCSCTNPPMRICPECVGQHIINPGNHMFSVYRPPVPRGGNDLCDACTNSNAESICSCTIPPKKYCGQCRILHINKSLDEVHSFLPVAALKFIKDERNFIELRDDVKRMNAIKQCLRANLYRINVFKEKLQETCQTFIRDIEEFLAQTMKELEERKIKLEEEIVAITSEMEEHAFDRAYQSANEKVNYIRSLPEDLVENSLKMFEFHIQVNSLRSYLKEAIYIDSLEIPPRVQLDFTVTVKGNKLTTYKLLNLEKKEQVLTADTGANLSTAIVFKNANTLFGAGGDNSNQVFSLTFHNLQ